MPASDRRYRGYRSDTIRLDSWDYRRSAWYFVTICTHNRIPYFGAVRGGIVGFSPAGCIAAQEWRRTPEVRPYVRLGAWIVMPNHVHGLIGITTESPGHDDATGTDTSECDGSNTTGDDGDSDGADASHRSGSKSTDPTPVDGSRHAQSNSPKSVPVDASRRDASTQENTGGSNDEFRLHAHSLGAIIGQYKSVCTKRIRAACRPDFGWQSRCYRSVNKSVRTGSPSGYTRPPTFGESNLRTFSRIGTTGSSATVANGQRCADTSTGTRQPGPTTGIFPPPDGIPVARSPLQKPSPTVSVRTPPISAHTE